MSPPLDFSIIPAIGRTNGSKTIHFGIPRGLNWFMRTRKSFRPLVRVWGLGKIQKWGAAGAEKCGNWLFTTPKAPKKLGFLPLKSRKISIFLVLRVQKNEITPPRINEIFGDTLLARGGGLFLTGVMVEP